MLGGAGSYGLCPELGLKDIARECEYELAMNSGKLDSKKMAPTSKFRELPVGKRMMPAPGIVPGVFQGKTAT